MRANALILSASPSTCSASSRQASQRTLARCLPVPGVYAAGSSTPRDEGLLVLTDDGLLQKRIADPRLAAQDLPRAGQGIPAGGPGAPAGGVDLGDFVTRPCAARLVANPPGCNHATHDRERKAIPTSWVEAHVLRRTKPPGAPDDRQVGFSDPALIACGWAIGRWMASRRANGAKLPARCRQLPAPGPRPGPPVVSPAWARRHASPGGARWFEDKKPDSGAVRSCTKPGGRWRDTSRSDDQAD